MISGITGASAAAAAAAGGGFVSGSNLALPKDALDARVILVGSHEVF